MATTMTMTMGNAMRCVLLIFIGFGLVKPMPAEVTHEELRGTIQSLIYSYNQLDNKLERHEHRERALGELLKKAMQSLQKGLKTFEPINGIFARLDERVSQIETMLITQEDKYNVQTDKLGETLEHIFKWMRENDECFRRPPGAGGADVPAAATSPLPENFVQRQQQTNEELLGAVKALNAQVAKLLDNSQNMMQQTQVAFSGMPNTAELLTKIEDKLVSYNTPVAVTPATIDNSALEAQLLEKFESLGSDLAALRAAAMAKEQHQALSNEDKEFMYGLANETLFAIANLKSDALGNTDSALLKTVEQVKASEELLGLRIKDISTDIAMSTQKLDDFSRKLNSSYSKMEDALAIFDKFNGIMMTNSEYVLDTQRKVEFGTLQIVQKIEKFLDQQHDELRMLLKERFGKVETSIVSTQQEAAKNLSSLIDTELGQVWHRIEIMTDEIGESSELLKLMQTGREALENSTFSTMIGLSGKVEETKRRMLDMDDNLNYLLGKLSLMSSEFANIKNGLAESLEELRQSFHTLQGQMPKTADSSNANIEKTKYDTDVNLLSKRDTN